MIKYPGIGVFKIVRNPLSANPTKWPNTVKQFVGKMPTNCLSVFDHFVILNDFKDLDLYEHRICINSVSIYFCNKYTPT